MSRMIQEVGTAGSVPLDMRAQYKFAHALRVIADEGHLSTDRTPYLSSRGESTQNMTLYYTMRCPRRFLGIILRGGGGRQSWFGV